MIMVKLAGVTFKIYGCECFNYLIRQIANYSIQHITRSQQLLAIKPEICTESDQQMRKVTYLSMIFYNANYSL